MDYVLPQLKMVLLMSVNPGYGGQSYIPYVTDKIRTLRRMITERGLEVDVEIDGGVKLSNAAQLLEAGANVLVAGSAVFSGNIEENVRKFMAILEPGK